MAKLVAAALAIAGALALAAGPASGRSARDALVRPGVGIGKVRLGMTLTEVRRALGRPEIVLRRQRLRFREHYAEYAWGGGTDWIVGVHTRDNRSRVVSVATGLERERTARGVGVGSTERVVRRRGGARCVGEARYDPDVYKDIMICYLGPSRRQAHTVFSLVEDCAEVVPPHSQCPPGKVTFLVYEVRVGEPRFMFGPH